MSGNTACCSVEAVVSFDDRGQLVIPKEVRKKFNLKAGDKFALISCTRSSSQQDCGEDGCVEACCFTLINTNQLNNAVQQTLGPMLSEIFVK